jgi:hypothetical protein
VAIQADVSSPAEVAALFGQAETLNGQTLGINGGPT